MREPGASRIDRSSRHPHSPTLVARQAATSVVLFPALVPALDVLSHPSATFPLGELQRWRGEVCVAAQVGGDAVLVRESKQCGHLPHINQVIEIH